MSKMGNELIRKIETGEMEMIPKKDLYLYVDIVCCSCGRLVAFSNTQQIGNHRYCNRCR